MGIKRTRMRLEIFLERCRLFLVLGRVSNLPTVWSNCLAAWLLGGAGPWHQLVSVCLGASLLYTGGMFLNDALDEEFDLQHRPERPIPSGQVNRDTVWALAAVFLILGWLFLTAKGMWPTLFATLLLGNIVVYNAVHKKTSLAPWLMAGCRFLLYLTAGVAAEKGLDLSIFWAALALGAYILGLSGLARAEYTLHSAVHWNMALLVLPVVLALMAVERGGLVTLIPMASLLLWIAWCLTNKVVGARIQASRGVGGLLAGIVLVDWVAVAGVAHNPHFIFMGLFLLSLLLQRTVPAT